MSDAFGWDLPAGAANDPNAPWNEPDIPEAECAECGAVWDCGDFHESWLSGLEAGYPFSKQMPRECPECHPEDFALETDPDHLRKVMRE